MTAQHVLIAAVIILAVFMAAMDLRNRYRLKKYSNQLTELLLKGRYEEFCRLSEMEQVQKSIPAFNLDYMRLNAAIMNDDDKRTDQLFAKFRKLSLPDSCKQLVYMRCLGYYLSKDDQKKIMQSVAEIHELNGYEETKKQADMAVRIVRDKSSQDLEDLLNRLNDSQNRQKAMDALLVSMIYANEGDEENSRKYRSLADEMLCGKEAQNV